MKKLLIALGLSIFLTACGTTPKPLIDSNVKIIRVDLGHGSATHIGNGYFLTAGHVIDGQTDVLIESSDGHVKTGSVISVNMVYDVGLIYVADFKEMVVHQIECRNPVLGEEISTVGNPLNQNFVTSWGKVSNASVVTIGSWKEAFLTNMPVLPGNSGGPVFDDNGEVIGIVVGMQNGSEKDISPVGINILVPSSTICKVLGKGIDFK